MKIELVELQHHGDELVQIFEHLGECYRAEGVRRVLYKVVPAAFRRLPGEGELYALF